jgi:TolB-like protein
MSEPSRAVFLSYASQDAGAARRICEALRAAGVEVWFDQNSLRGGDAWDASIRRQIKNCALFIPVISRNTHQREEGYFRLEWKLAVDRSHLMTSSRAFLVPVAIDDTGDDDEHVPDRFRELQWTRLPGGETSAEFVERVLRLLAHDESTASASAHSPLPATPAAVGAFGATPQPAAAGTPAKRPGWRFSPVLMLVIAVVVITLGYVVMRRLMPTRQQVAGSGPGTQSLAQAAATAPEAISLKSIAVLPFVNMSSDKDQEYFSDGLSEELIDLLSQVPDLRVPARTSSFYFKGKSEDVATIARTLRVAHVLEGSVRKAGHTVRVTAQLIRADNGYHLWSKTYDRDVRDIFKVQDEIAATVVEALKAKLLPAQELTGRHRTASTEAYTQYLLGIQFRVHDTPDANRRALAAFSQAIRLDPGYAAAYSGLSETEWRIADQVTGEPAAYQRSLAAAERAIALAPDSPEGYWARGQLRNYYYFDWQGAQADYQKALALDPNYVPALIQSGDLLATLGNLREGVATIRKAIALDPLSVVAWRRLIRLNSYSGQFSAAREAVDRLGQIDPQSDSKRNATELELLAGRPREALVANEAETTLYRFFVPAAAQHMLGHAAEAQRALDSLVQGGANTMAYQIAEIHAWRGEKDQAFDWLERAYRQRDGGLTYLGYDRFLDSLRSDPRFRALMKKMKLPLN